MRIANANLLKSPMTIFPVSYAYLIRWTNIDNVNVENFTHYLGNSWNIFVSFQYVAATFVTAQCP